MRLGIQSTSLQKFPITNRDDISHQFEMRSREIRKIIVFYCHCGYPRYVLDLIYGIHLYHGTVHCDQCHANRSLVVHFDELYLRNQYGMYLIRRRIWSYSCESFRLERSIFLTLIFAALWKQQLILCTRIIPNGAKNRSPMKSKRAEK